MKLVGEHLLGALGRGGEEVWQIRISAAFYIKPSPAAP
jgi:hypothetical protein